MAEGPAQEVYFGENEENENQNNQNNGNQLQIVYENENTYVPNNNNNNANKPKLDSEVLYDLIEANDLDGVRKFLNEKPSSLIETLKERAFVNAAIHNLDVRSRKNGFEKEDVKKANAILEMLVGKKFSLEQTFMGQKPVALAAGMENEKVSLEILKLLILKMDLLANGGPKEDSPLLNALEKNHKEVVNFLIKAGADVNKVVEGNPLLHKVLFDLKNLKAVEFLLEKGANINQQNAVKDTVLHLLMKNKFEEPFLSDAYNLLLNSRFLSPERFDYYGRHPLLSAVTLGNLYAVKKLLDSPKKQFDTYISFGKKDNTQSRWNDRYIYGDQAETPIRIAIKRSSLSPPELGKKVAEEEIYNEILELLFQKGTLSKSQWDDLIFALSQENIDFIEQILYQKKFDLLKSFIQKRYININDFIGEDTLLTLSIKLLQTKTTDLDVIKMLLELGANPNLPNRKGATPMLLAYQTGDKELVALLLKHGGTKQGIFIGACQMGLVDLVKDLLAEGVDPEQTVKIGNKDFTGYDLATSLKIKLLLLPHLEKKEDRFEGFKLADFSIFDFIAESLNDKDSALAICPICFGKGTLEDGCMYIRDHNCKTDREAMRKYGQSLHIHEKLYDAYNENYIIKYCIWCNRLTNDRVGSHRHYDIGGPAPVKSMLPKTLDIKGGGYFDKTCYKNGGGDKVEKVYRFQELLNFMCYLNKKFIGKISQNMAYNIIKEVFIGAAVPYASFFTSYQSEPRNEKESEVVQLVAEIAKNKKFNMPKDCVPVDAEVKAVKEAVKANIPRPPQNADVVPKVLKQQAYDPATIEGEPVPPVAPPRNLPVAQYIPAFQAYQRELIPYMQLKAVFNAKMEPIAKKCVYHNERHKDGRDLLQFFHRQSDGEINDHENGLICKEGLVEYLSYLASNPHTVECFYNMCDGYIHPLEIEALMTTDDEKKVYEEYKKRFNNNPPAALAGQAGGANKNNSKRFTVLFHDSIDVGEPEACPLSPYQKLRKGGKRRTRKVRMVKKTRKAKHFGRTRKH